MTDDGTGTSIPGGVDLQGHLICASREQVERVTRALAAHVERTRAEPGCLRFEVHQTADPLVWEVAETYADEAAFAAHQERAADSEWGRATAGIARQYAIRQGDRWFAKLTEALGPDAVEAQVGAYAYPGPLRDSLVGAILRGEKTATASLVEDYQRLDEPLPAVGDIEVVVDSNGRPVCVTRNTGVRIERFADVDDAHAIAEGEGFEDAAAWRVAHHAFWTSPEFVADVGAPAIVIDDDTRVVLVATEVLASV